MTPAWRDLDTLARTVWGEARGESEQGRVAVAHVAINRARLARSANQNADGGGAAGAAGGKRQKLFGDGTIAGACLAPKQFSCWNGAGAARLRALSADDPGYHEALWAALAATLRKIPDPTGGATHYHADHVSPLWAKGRHPACAIGRHKFYNDVP